MVVSCWSLLLLVAVLSLSGATEFYVRPTEPPNTPCPSQPCLTLNAYYAEYNHYFKSNTVFRFMQGTHHIDRPLVFSNLDNVSLEAAAPHTTSSMQPEIVATFKCNLFVDLLTSMRLFTLNFALDASECSSIQVSDSYDIRFKRIKVRSNVTEWKIHFLPFNVEKSLAQSHFVTTIVSGEISFNDVKNVLLYNITATRGVFVNNSIDFSAANCIFGYINNFEPLCDQSLYPTNDSLYGVFIHNTSNIVMRNITVINTLNTGILLQGTNHTKIDNVALLFMVYGNALHLNSSWNTNINNINIQKICNSHVAAYSVVLLERAIFTVMKGIKVNGNIFMVNCIETTFVNLSMANLKIREGFSVFTCTNVTLQNSTFTDFMDPGTLSTDVNSLPAVVLIYFSLGIRVCDCTFARNNITNIKSIASNFFLSGDIKFLESRALSGTAIIISHKSNMTLEEDCNAAFINNHATRTGGAIHVMTGEAAVVDSWTPWCFLHVSGNRDHPRLVFRGNTAEKGGDVLYGGWLEIGYSGQTTNCMQSFKNISNISQDGLSLIASDSSRVCLCNSSGRPDCLKLVYPERKTIYPGQTINVSVVATGQDFGTVAGSVFVQFLRPPHNSVPKLEALQYTQAVGKDYCNLLNYTIYHSQEGPSNAVLVFTPEYKDVSYFISNDSHSVSFSMRTFKQWAKYIPYTPFPKEILEYPMYVNITLLPCPLGFQLDGILPKCECINLLMTLPGVKCDIRDQTISRTGLVWVGVMKESNGTLATSEYCPLNYCHSKEIRIGLGEFNSQCNYDRSGILCGECKPGLSVALGSSQCLSCSNWYLTLAVPFAMAGVALVFLIKLLDLTTSHGTITGLIFYANIVKANEFIFLPRKETNPLTIFISWLNLDLGIETCFWDGLTSYSKTWLQFAFPLYIWAIAGGIIILSKYFDGVAKVMGKNSVSVLATLFFLSYAKLLRTIIVALSYTIIETSQGHKAVWSADGNLDYLGPYHALLFSVCVATLLFLWLPYTLLLFCGQWLHRCNCRPVIRMLMKIKPFLDAYYGPIKGTHRYWFGAQLLVRAVILLISATVPSNNSGTIVLSISVSSVVLLGFSSIGLYHSKFISIFELSFFMNLALLGLSTFFAMTTERNPTTATYVLIGVAFAQFCGLMMYRLAVIFDAKRRILACFCCCAHCLGEEEDDWELYERAALERENEARMANNDDTSSEGSVNSLPTY